MNDKQCYAVTAAAAGADVVVVLDGNGGKLVIGS